MIWIFLTVAILAIGYCFLTKPFKYWTNVGVKQDKPVILLGDNWRTMFRKQSFAEMVKHHYDIHPGTRYSGLYQFYTPILVLKDPELIKQITVKDFEQFTDHRSFAPDISEDLFSKNLFALKGKPWREMRTILSPAFTSSKMKQMFVLMIEASENFVNYFKKQCNSDVMEIEFKDTFTRFANDVIATTAFGIGVDSLNEPDNEFYLMGKDATNLNGFWRTVKLFGFILLPRIVKLLKINLLGNNINEFFLKIVKETIKIREEQKIVRPDMINLLLEAKKGTAKQEDPSEFIDTGFATVKEIEHHEKYKTTISDFDIAAQAFSFFFAGFDSVSTAMSFAAHELAVNPDIQNKLRTEINETLTSCPGGKLTYEALLKMKYLDMVVSETLRKYPSSVAVDRVCNKPYVIPSTSPDEVPIHLEEGVAVWIPIYGLHHDPKYYPDPERFDPERFNDDNKVNIDPYRYLPFGAGPRNCIGSRFALLEIKTIFFYILSNFELVPIEKTEIPLTLSKKSFSMTVDNGFWLGLKPLKKTN